MLRNKNVSVTKEKFFDSREEGVGEGRLETLEGGEVECRTGVPGVLMGYRRFSDVKPTSTSFPNDLHEITKHCRDLGIVP